MNFLYIKTLCLMALLLAWRRQTCGRPIDADIADGSADDTTDGPAGSAADDDRMPPRAKKARTVATTQTPRGQPVVGSGLSAFGVPISQSHGSRFPHAYGSLFRPEQPAAGSDLSSFRVYIPRSYGSWLPYGDGSALRHEQPAAGSDLSASRVYIPRSHGSWLPYGHGSVLRHGQPDVETSSLAFVPYEETRRRRFPRGDTTNFGPIPRSATGPTAGPTAGPTKGPVSEDQICRVCNKTFSSKSNRNSHERTRHNYFGLGDYRCAVEGCPYRFMSETELERHLSSAVHRQTPSNYTTARFICRICGKDFMTQTSRRIHEGSSHGYYGVGAHKCGENGCPVRFSNPSSLAKHQRATGHRGTLYLNLNTTEDENDLDTGSESDDTHAAEIGPQVY